MLTPSRSVPSSPGEEGESPRSENSSFRVSEASGSPLREAPGGGAQAGEARKEKKDSAGEKEVSSEVPGELPAGRGLPSFTEPQSGASGRMSRRIARSPSLRKPRRTGLPRNTAPEEEKPERNGKAAPDRPPRATTTSSSGGEKGKPPFLYRSGRTGAIYPPAVAERYARRCPYEGEKLYRVDGSEPRMPEAIRALDWRRFEKVGKALLKRGYVACIEKLPEAARGSRRRRRAGPLRAYVIPEKKSDDLPSEVFPQSIATARTASGGAAAVFAFMEGMQGGFEAKTPTEAGGETDPEVARL